MDQTILKVAMGGMEIIAGWYITQKISASRYVGYGNAYAITIIIVINSTIKH
jgi:hypothetical protein